MKDAVTFGGWLKQKRRERGITLEELAGRISCSRVTLVKIEAGERRPSLQIAQLLAEQFDIPPDERDAFTVFARTGGASPAPDLPADDDAILAHAPGDLPYFRPNNNATRGADKQDRL